MLEITPFPGQPVLQALRELYLGGRDGVVEVAHATGRQTLLLRAGTLHATAEDPLGARLAGADAAQRTEVLLRSIERWSGPEIERILAAPERALRMSPGVPVAELFMAAATLGRGEAQLLELLGGEETRLQVQADAAAIAGVPGLDPEDAFLLSRLERPMSVGDLLRQSRGERGATLARLSRLRAVGLIGAPQPETAPPGEGLRQRLDRFAARIADDLAATPLALGKEEHRRRLLALFGRFGAQSHYELLGVEPDAGNETLHRAYLELARLVHPRHASSLELGEGAAALALLFERATEAYLVLTDPAQRGRYDLEAGIGVSAPRRSEAERAEERRRLARQAFDLATQLAEAQEYHFAVELLRQSVAADPRPEAWSLLANCQAKNPRWSAQAADSARHALRLQPGDFTLQLLLAQLCERDQKPEEAAAAYQAALRLQPGHPEAAAGLARLRDAGKAPRAGVLGWLRERLPGRRQESSGRRIG
ncbi:MAG TPA: J domain-containing protein [Thermoanaerobaculia bacterium]|nr:J domain-containing protein [Thermoanaerobaculia bacterium]